MGTMFFLLITEKLWIADRAMILEGCLIGSVPTSSFIPELTFVSS
jgi:hypothetical protein